MNYTVIVRSICGDYLHTHHYERKADALAEVAFNVGIGCRVEIMKYSVWLNR